MDEGWTRWLLEQYGFELINIRNGDFRALPLGERFDIIILPEPGRQSLLEGFSTGTVPPKYSSGIGAQGVRALDEFVRGGGTLVCLNRASRFAVQELHLPVEDVVSDLPRDQYFASGSILELIVDTAHPVMAGTPPKAKVYVGRSPVFTAQEGFQGMALAKYQDAGSPLLSGYLLGEEHLNAHAAALDVHHGKGHVVLFGFRPQWRGQSFGTFRMLFNAALFHGEIASRAQGSPGFWSPPPVSEKGPDEPEKKSGGL
jgi:hypothetical protein